MINTWLTYINLYIPIFVLSILSGWGGLINRKQFSWKAMIEIGVGNGILGVVTLIFLQEFLTDVSIEVKYALIVLISFLGRDEAIGLYQKFKQMKGL